jgi:hypothetical protein
MSRLKVILGMGSFTLELRGCRKMSVMLTNLVLW